MNEILLLTISILPVILIGSYIYKKDKAKEPTKFLVKLFISGVLSCFIVLFLSLILEIIFPFFASNTSNLNLLELFIYILFKIALIEEVCKWAFVYSISYNNKYFDEAFDMIIYSVFVSLGFAFFENILYVYEGGMLVGIFRALSAVPGHACYGILMGYSLTLAKKNKNSKKHIFLSIFIPTLLHGIYDFLVFSENIYCLLIFIPFIVGLFVCSIKKIKKILKIYPALKNNFCPECGTKVTGNYCSHCGRKNN